PPPASRSSEAKIEQIAFSAGGRSIATCSELNPDHEVPYIPTLPLDQGRSASQAIPSAGPSSSPAVYSPVASPSEEPVPRMSSRHTTYPNSSANRWYSGREGG